MNWKKKKLVILYENYYHFICSNCDQILKLQFTINQFEHTKQNFAKEESDLKNHIDKLKVFLSQILFIKINWIL